MRLDILLPYPDPAFGYRGANNQLNATRVISDQTDREKERDRQTSAVQTHATQNSGKQRESPQKPRRRGVPAQRSRHQESASALLPTPQKGARGRSAMGLPVDDL